MAPSSPKAASPMRARWGVLVLVAVLVLSAGLLQTRPGHTLLQKAGFFEVPASYTELAFTAPGDLPSQLKSQRVPLDVSFGIHNVSGSSRTYRWSVVLLSSGSSHVAATGVAQTPAQGPATVATTVAAKTVARVCVAQRIQVVVRLAGLTESIDFWVTCPPHSRSVR